MAASGRHTGWHFDPDNTRLDMYYRGTRVGHIDACGISSALGATVACSLTVTAGGLTVTAGGATITAGGLTVTACGATVTAGDVTVTAGDLILTGADIRVGACGDLQLLCPCGTDIFLATACCEPSAAKGTVWSWAGAAGAVAPCGSGFLMIVDDGCV